jgi:putative protein kinase ArgK-like GTPase of G3E family
MNKIDRYKINKANKDIWAMIDMAMKTDNRALLEANLTRLSALQKYYLDLLNFQDTEISLLKADTAFNQKLIDDRDKEWLIEVAKRNGIYDKLKERINTQYQEV